MNFVQLLKKNLAIAFEIKWLNSFLIMCLGLFIGLFFFTFNIIGFNFTHFPGDLGDSRLNLYFLEHSHLFFTGKLDSFWNAPFMFPEKRIITYSDNLLGSAPIYSLFRLCSIDSFKSFQLWFMTVSALNYICAFYFLRYISKNDYSAILGAFIFAFSLALQSQLSHAQTFPRYAVPLALLMAVRFEEDLRPRYFFCTLFFLVYQFYCGIYLGFMLAVPVGLYLLITLIKKGITGIKQVINFKWIAQMLVCLIVNIGLLLLLMTPYISRKIPPSLDTFKEISSSIPDLTSYFYSKEGSLFWDFLSTNGIHNKAHWNHQIFVGGLAMLCFLISITMLFIHLVKTKFRFKSLAASQSLTLVGLLLVLIYLRFDEISAYIALYFLPGFSSMKAVSRIINIELIFFGISTAFTFSILFERSFRHKFIYLMIILSLLIGDNYLKSSKSYRTSIDIARERTEVLEKSFASVPKGALVSYEPLKIESSSIEYQLDAMLLSQKFGLKTVNGYTSSCPSEYICYWNRPMAASRNSWLLSKGIELDTLYVVKDSNYIEKVPFSEIQHFEIDATQEKSLQDIVNSIAVNPQWMMQVAEKAQINNLSIDSMLILDAHWVLNNE
jgi:hypothetical protein